MRKLIGLEFAILRKLLIAATLLAVFFSLYNSRLATIHACDTIQCLFVLAYGDLNIEAIKYVIPVIFWLVPQIVLLYLLGDYITRDLEQHAVYIFTRTERRTSWLLAKLVNVWLFVCFYFAVLLLVTAVVGTIFGFRLAIGAPDIALIVYEYALLVLLNVMNLFLINLLSLKINVTFSTVSVLAVNIGCLFCAQWLYEFYPDRLAIVQWLPFTQGILSWHSSLLPTAHGELFPLHVPPLSPLFSIAYMLVICAVAIVIGNARFNKMDLM
ncbi:DUF2705 family protein [Numidum massiliense]|uniref:DUF2705 family protein n=1 Tax=Numidum massiliense TaxID=1522315 RepID=UPI0006D5839A|nr:DUF2705 family protein [Numidum massiliense]